MAQRRVQRESDRGPIVYEIACRINAGERAAELFEFPIFTDAHITGEVGIPPFTIINPVAVEQRAGYFRPALVIRAEIPALQQRAGPMLETDTSLYHGGTALDEIAALLSLCLQIRAKAGSVNRIFQGDPIGRPIAWEQEPWPESRPIGRAGLMRLPWVAGTHDLSPEALSRIAALHAMTPGQATALIKAARAYQDALWIGEWEPERAWIDLVAAIEAADIFLGDTKASDADLLLQYNPEIAEPLFNYGGQKLLDKLAPLLRSVFGSTRKFCDFIDAYLPDPPLQRPPTGFQLGWDRTTIQKAMRLIYGHRSRALHDATPIPLPMCSLPFREVNWDAPSEVPLAIASSSRYGTWVHKDTPMLLHMFAHIVRGVLLNWWDACINVSPDTA